MHREEFDMETIGQRIKYLREQHHLNQTELATILGVSNKSVSAWESNLKEPRMGAIEKMAKYFGVSKTDLIDGTGVLSNPTHTILTEQEECLIQVFRAFDDKHKAMLCAYMEFLGYDQKDDLK